MSSISLSAFRTQLDEEVQTQGPRRYEWDEGGVLVPTPSNTPPPSAPTRRPARDLPTGPSPFGILSAVIDDACNVRRLVGPDAFRNSTLPTAALGAASPTWRNTFDSAWNRLCGDSPGAHPGTESPIVPFQGGQCDGARYTVQCQVQLRGSPPGCNISLNTTGNPQVWGPITGVDLGPVNGIGQFCRVFCRGVATGPIQPPGTIVSLGSYPNTSGCPVARIVSVNVQPVPGQPNNCGSPPPRYQPAGRPTLPPRNITIDLGGTPVTITPTITFNVDEGAIQIDAGPDLNVTFDGVNLNFGDDGGGGTPGSTPVRPSPDDTGTDPADPAPPPPAEPPYEEPEEPPEEVIRGVLVTVTGLSDELTVIAGQQADPDNYFPDTGTVKFRCRVEVGSSGFTNPIRVQGLRTFVPCPWDGGAFEVVGTPRPGVTWTLTPVYDVPIT